MLQKYIIAEQTVKGGLGSNINAMESTPKEIIDVLES